MCVCGSSYLVSVHFRKSQEEQLRVTPTLHVLSRMATPLAPSHCVHRWNIPVKSLLFPVFTDRLWDSFFFFFHSPTKPDSNLWNNLDWDYSWTRVQETIEREWIKANIIGQSGSDVNRVSHVNITLIRSCTTILRLWMKPKVFSRCASKW